MDVELGILSYLMGARMEDCFYTLYIPSEADPVFTHLPQSAGSHIIPFLKAWLDAGREAELPVVCASSQGRGLPDGGACQRMGDPMV